MSFAADLHVLEGSIVECDIKGNPDETKPGALGFRRFVVHWKQGVDATPERRRALVMTPHEALLASNKSVVRTYAGDKFFPSRDQKVVPSFAEGLDGWAQARLAPAADIMLSPEPIQAILTDPAVLRVLHTLSTYKNYRTTKKEATDRWVRESKRTPEELLGFAREMADSIAKDAVGKVKGAEEAHAKLEKLLEGRVKRHATQIIADMQELIQKLSTTAVAEFAAWTDANPRIGKGEDAVGKEATLEWALDPSRSLWQLQQFLILINVALFTATSPKQEARRKISARISKLTAPPPAGKGSAVARRAARLRPMADAMAAVGNAYGAARPDTSDELANAVLTAQERNKEEFSLRWLAQETAWHRKLEEWIASHKSTEPGLEKSAVTDFWFWGVPADVHPALSKHLPAAVRRTREGGTLLWRPTYDTVLNMKGFVSLVSRMALGLSNWGTPISTVNTDAKTKEVTDFNWRPSEILSTPFTKYDASFRSRKKGTAGVLINALLPWLAAETWKDRVYAGMGPEHKPPLDVLEGKALKSLSIMQRFTLDLTLTEWGEKEEEVYEGCVAFSTDMMKLAVTTLINDKYHAKKEETRESKITSLASFLATHIMYERNYRQKRRLKLGDKHRLAASKAAESARTAAAARAEGAYAVTVATKSVWDWTVNALWAATPVDSMAYAIARQGISVATLGNHRMMDGTNKVETARALFTKRIREALDRMHASDLGSGGAGEGWIRPGPIRSGKAWIKALATTKWNEWKGLEYIAGKAWGMKSDALVAANQEMMRAVHKTGDTALADGVPMLNGTVPPLSITGMDGEELKLEGDSSGLQPLWDDISSQQAATYGVRPPKTWGALAAYMVPVMDMENQARANAQGLAKTGKAVNTLLDAGSMLSRKIRGVSSVSGAGSAIAVGSAGAALMAVGTIAAGAFMVWRTHMTQALESYTKDEVQLPARHWYIAAKEEAQLAGLSRERMVHADGSTPALTLGQQFAEQWGGELAANLRGHGIAMMRGVHAGTQGAEKAVSDTSQVVRFRIGVVKGEPRTWHKVASISSSSANGLRSAIYNAMKRYGGVRGTLDHMMLASESTLPVLRTMFDGWMEARNYTQWKAHVQSSLVLSVTSDAAPAKAWSDDGMRAIRARMMQEEVEDRAAVAQYQHELDAFTSKGTLSKWGTWASAPEELEEKDFRSFRDFTKDGSHNNMALNILSESALQDWAPSYMSGGEAASAGLVSAAFLHCMGGMWVCPRVDSLPTPSIPARIMWPLATSTRTRQYLAWQHTATRVTGTPSLRVLVHELAAHELMVGEKGGGAAAVSAWKQGEFFVRLRDIIAHLWVRRAPYVYDVLYILRSLWTLMRLGLWGGRDWVKLGAKSKINWEDGSYTLPSEVAADTHAFRGLEAYIALVRAARSFAGVWPATWDSKAKAAAFLDPAEPANRATFLRRAQHPYYTFASHATLEYCYLAVLQLDTPVARLGEIEDTREVTSCLLSAIVMTSVAFMRDKSAAMSPETRRWMERAQAWLSTAGATHNPALRVVWKFLGTGFLNMLHTAERAEAEKLQDSMVAQQWEELVWSETMPQKQEEEGVDVGGGGSGAFRGRIGGGAEAIATAGLAADETRVDAALRIMSDPRRWRKPADWNQGKWEDLVKEVVSSRRTSKNAAAMDELEEVMLSQVAPAEAKPTKATPDLLLTWRVRDSMEDDEAWDVLTAVPEPKFRRLTEMWARSMGMGRGKYHKTDKSGAGAGAGAGAKKHGHSQNRATHTISACDAIHVQNMRAAQTKGAAATTALAQRTQATLLMNVVAILAAANPNTDGGVTRSVTRMLGRAASMVAMTAQVTFVAHGVYKSVQETGGTQTAAAALGKSLWKARGNPFNTETAYALSLLLARTSFTVINWVRNNSTTVTNMWEKGRTILREQYVARREHMGAVSSFLVGAADSLVSWVDGDHATQVSVVSAHAKEESKDTVSFPELDELDESLRETFRVAMTLSEKEESNAGVAPPQEEAAATDLGAFHGAVPEEDMEGMVEEDEVGALQVGVHNLASVFDDRVAMSERVAQCADVEGAEEWSMEEASHTALLESAHMLTRTIVIPRISHRLGVHASAWNTPWADADPGFVDEATVLKPRVPVDAPQVELTAKWLSYFTRDTAAMAYRPDQPYVYMWCAPGVLPLTWPHHVEDLLPAGNDWAVVVHAEDGSATGRFAALVVRKSARSSVRVELEDALAPIGIISGAEFYDMHKKVPDSNIAAAAEKLWELLVSESSTSSPAATSILTAFLPQYFAYMFEVSSSNAAATRLYRAYLLRVLRAVASLHNGKVHTVNTPLHVLSVPAQSADGVNKTAPGLPAQTQLAELLPPPHRLGLEGRRARAEQNAAASAYATKYCASRADPIAWLKEYGGLRRASEEGGDGGGGSGSRSPDSDAGELFLRCTRFAALDGTVCQVVLRHAVNPFTEPGLHEVDMNVSGKHRTNAEVCGDRLHLGPGATNLLDRIENMQLLLETL